MFGLFFKKKACVEPEAVVEDNVAPEPQEEKNISEPIYTFANLLKEQPKRFGLVRDAKSEDITIGGITIDRYEYYVFYDKVLKKEWTIGIFKSKHHNRTRLGVSIGLEWLTFEEKLFLQEAVEAWFKERVKKTSAWKIEKIKNRLQKGRQELIDLYCGENKDG